jgi:CheY-like chemotaxis protein
VLVVDDNTDAADTLATLLAVGGHDVRTATSGPAAIALTRGFIPDIAFLDIGMPGMSGYELARQLRHDRALDGTMLVAVTGWGQAEDRRLSKEAGFDGHMTKPVEPADVLSLVAKANVRSRQP